MADEFYQKYGPIERRRQNGDVQQFDATAPLADDLPVRSAAPPKRQRSRLRTFMWGAGITLGLVGLLFGIGLWYLNRTFEGRIYPNVAIQGIDMSQKTPEEAKALLTEQYADLLKRPVGLSFNGQTWEPTADQAGISLSIEQSVDEAYSLGRGGNIINTLQAVSGIWQNGYDIPLAVTVDQAQLSEYLTTATNDLITAPVNANLIVAGNTATMTPAREGRLILIDETAQDILTQLQTLSPAQVVLRTEMVMPTVLDDGVFEAKQTIDAVLQSPLTLIAGDLQWELSTDDLRALIRLDTHTDANGKTKMVASLNDQMIRQRVATFADEIGRGSVNPRVAWDGGALTIVREGRTGLRLDEEASARRIIEQATIGETRTIELVIREVQPDVTAENIHSLGIVEAVGVGKSSYKGSASYRVTNIKAGSRLLDGILIKPGEEFSFNNAVGSIDESNGFVKGYAIVGNRTQEEWGGGICQDSTTLFRAAFHAGLPITERHTHSFRISWYEVYEPYGMDAAIFTGALDFRFVNDTGKWLLLNTYVDDSTATVTYALYGTAPQREVILDGPYVTKEYPKPTEPTYVADPKEPVGVFHQTDTARDGMDIIVYRIIRQDGQVILREPFNTHFKPWPDIYVHNPATPLPPKGCKPTDPCANPATPTPEPPPPQQPEPTPEPQPEPTPGGEIVIPTPSP